MVRSLGRRVPVTIEESDEDDLEVTPPASAAAGIPAVTVALKRAMTSMGPVRTARSLLRLNQTDGFDCQGCAWPDPDPSQRHTAEFCENGARRPSPRRRRPGRSSRSSTSSTASRS